MGRGANPRPSTYGGDEGGAVHLTLLAFAVLVMALIAWGLKKSRLC